MEDVLKLFAAGVLILMFLGGHERTAELSQLRLAVQMYQSQLEGK